jgi:hypothetical protein
LKERGIQGVRLKNNVLRQRESAGILRKSGRVTRSHPANELFYFLGDVT